MSTTPIEGDFWRRWAKPARKWNGSCMPIAFREELLEMIEEKRTPGHTGEEVRESEEQKAERLIGGLLRKLGWSDDELENRAKGDKAKARMAEKLRARTTMTWAWIAQRLRMGHWRTAFNATRTLPKSKGKK